MRLVPVLLTTAIMVSACGGAGTGSARSPSTSPTTTPEASASPSASPLPSEGGYGVLVTGAEGTYTVSVVGADGKVAAQSEASMPATVSCSDATGAVVPAPVSTSNSRAYFMDAQGVVRFLAPSGETGRATSVPAGSHRRSMFAVSPDDQRIAVVVSDFTASGAATSLYVEDLSGGAHHHVIFTESGAFGLWPTGWHGASLVVAKVPTCGQFIGPFNPDPLERQELHVIDPASALRKFTLGGPGCVIAGPPSAAGAVCETGVQANVVDWSGTTTRSFSIQAPTPAYLSPNGNQAAMVASVDTVVEGSYTTLSGFEACAWIDSTRLLGTNDQGQPLVGDISTGTVVPVAASGLCAGRIPGGL